MSLVLGEKGYDWQLLVGGSPIETVLKQGLPLKNHLSFLHHLFKPLAAI